MSLYLYWGSMCFVVGIKEKKIISVLCNRAFMFQMCFTDNNKWLFLFRNLGRDIVSIENLTVRVIIYMLAIIKGTVKSKRY